MNEQIIKVFPNYKARTDGTILSKRKGWRNPITKTWKTEENWQPLKPIFDKATGYYVVTLIAYDALGFKIKKNQFIHRLLCQAFLSNPQNKAHVNHIDGNKLNNNLSNLEWVTEKENSQHAVNIGLTTFAYCEKGIKQFTKTGECINYFKSIHEAGRQTNIAFQNISKVLRGLRKTAGGFYWEYV